MNVVVIAPNWVGDAVMTQPLLAALKSTAARVDVLAVSWVADVYRRMSEVDQILDSPLRHSLLAWSAQWHCALKIRKGDYDCAIVVPISWKAALIPWLAGIPKRVGFFGEHRYFLLTQLYCLNPRLMPKMVDHYMVLSGQFRCAPHPRLAANIEHARRVVAKNSLTQEGPILVLCPGAEYGPAKQWPAEHFAKIAQLWQKKGPVWVMGSPKDCGIAQVIATHAPHVANLCGRTNLGEAIDLLALAHIVVANDSGLMHVACALGRRVVAIYGSTDPAYAPPGHDQAKTVTQNLSCSPCRQRVCPLGHTRCLTTLSPAVVWSAITAQDDRT